MISVLLFFSIAFANSNSEWRFESTNNKGSKELYILHQENGEYFFNGKSLGKKLSAEEMKIWKVVIAGPVKEIKKSCPAGQYTFTTQRAKSKKEQQGCIQGTTFGAYRKSIDDLFKIAKGRK